MRSPGRPDENLRVVSTYHDLIRQQWFDEWNNVVDTAGDLRDVPPGTYFLRAYITENCYEEYSVTIGGPRADLSAMVVQDVTCNAPGQITGINLAEMEDLEVFWVNSRGTRLGDGPDLLDITRGGEYRLAAVGEADCDTIWAAYVTVAETGIPQFDEQALEIIPVSCDGVTLGSIIGLSVEGAVSFSWHNEGGQEVGTELDLVGVPLGRYRLTVITSDGCEGTSDWYEVVAETVEFPAYDVALEQPSCAGNDGALQIDWGTEAQLPHTWRWLDSQGAEVGNALRADELVPGTYRLELFNESGCVYLDPREFELTQAPPVQLDTTAVYVRDVARESNSGAISGIVVVGGTAPYTYNWYNEMDVLVGNEADLSGIPAGVYVLEVIDARGCRSTTIPIMVNTFNGDDLRVSNTFSPNGDSYNDTWFPGGLERYPSALVRVFDRQGQQVYAGRSTDEPFNGQYQGTDLPVGAYYYLIDLGNEYPALKGSLNLLR